MCSGWHSTGIMWIASLTKCEYSTRSFVCVGGAFRRSSSTLRTLNFWTRMQFLESVTRTADMARKRCGNNQHDELTEEKRAITRAEGRMYENSEPETKPWRTRYGLWQDLLNLGGLWRFLTWKKMQLLTSWRPSRWRRRASLRDQNT